MKVKIKYLGLGYKDNYQAKIKVYDGNTLIYEDLTYNGEILLNLKCNHIYTIESIFYNAHLFNTIYTNNNCYIFTFKHNTLDVITFNVIDYYYDLKIERGELILWKNQ